MMSQEMDKGLRFLVLMVLLFGSQAAFAQSGGMQGGGNQPTGGAQENLSKADEELRAKEEALLKQVQGSGVTAATGERLEPAPELSAPVVKKEESVKEAPKVELDQASMANELEAAPPAVVKKKVETAPKEVVKTKKSEAASTSACDNSALVTAQNKIKKLQSDLEEAKNRLMVSETEVERLALLIDARNSAQPRSVTSQAARDLTNGTKLRVRDDVEIQAKADSDMPIATVVSEKAQLRTGPGKDNSPLMTVAQGTRLAIETRNGDWYRVIAPTGARAWISSDVIDFGPGAQSPESAARGKGLTATDEEAAAFEALSKGASNR